jgi:hypothetical protein
MEKWIEFKLLNLVKFGSYFYELYKILHKKLNIVLISGTIAIVIFTKRGYKNEKFK